VLGWLWWPFRAQAEWLERRLDGRSQMALGALFVDAGIVMFLVGFTTDEPFLIYQMSAGAIFATGLAFVAAGQAVLEGERAQEPHDG
jgi:hypothetical protein